MALIGVIITLAWNRKKHREDRELALKKDAFVTFLKTVGSSASQWLVFVGEPPSSAAQISEAAVCVRLVASQASREAATILIEHVSEANTALARTRVELANYRRILKGGSTVSERMQNLSVTPEFAAQRQNEMFDEMLKLVEQFGPLHNAAVRAFRRELGLSEDAKWFETRTGIDVKEIKERFHRS